MKTIDRLLLKSYSGPMVLTFFIVVFIFVMQFLWMYMDDIAGKGLEWSVIGELLFWMALTTIPMALPLSTLLASIMTMGNLGENNELLALKSAGISLQRIMRPLMILVFIISILAFYISNNLLPMSNLKLDTLLRDVKAKNPVFALDVGVFSSNLPGYSIKMGDKDSKTNLLRELMIYNHSSIPGNTSVTIADSGYISMLESGDYLITLYSGNAYEDERNREGLITDDRPFSHREFEQQEFLVQAEEWARTDEEQNKGKMQMLSLVDLTKSIDSLKKQQELEASRSFSYYISSSAFTNSSELDTAQAAVARHVKPVNTDSIFSSYDDKQKYEAVTNAVNRLENSKMELEYAKAEREIKRRDIAQGEVEWHMKFTLSVACMIFFFIGAPLGAIIRKGGLGMPMVVSLFLFIIYWVIFSTGKKMAIQGSWNAAFAMWLPTIILLPLGIFLTYKATSDSSLFNADKYLGWIKKIFGKRKVARVDLSQITPLTDSLSKIEGEIIELNNLCRQFEKEYKLHTNFTNSIACFSMADSYNKLHYIDSRYKQLLSHLIAINNDEYLRSLLGQYPIFNDKNYKSLSGLSFNIQAYSAFIGLMFIIFFPITIILYGIVVRKRKKIRYTLYEIIRINDLVSDFLTKNERYKT